MNQEQKLKWLVLSGVTESIGEAPVNRLKSPDPNKGASIPEAGSENLPENSLLKQACQMAEEAQNLEDLYQKRSDFDGCPLKKTAVHTLNGRGVLNPDLMCLTEAPDTADEKVGLLMSGEAGILLDKMLGAIGLDLSKNAYVSSLIPWRAPGNRAPTEVELALCRPFWEREIEFIKPKILLLFGSGVAKSILGISALSKARGVWHTYQGIPTRVSLAPATLLKLPQQKKMAWADLQQVQAELKK